MFSLKFLVLVVVINGTLTFTCVKITIPSDTTNGSYIIFYHPLVAARTLPGVHIPHFGNPSLIDLRFLKLIFKCVNKLTLMNYIPN